MKEYLKSLLRAFFGSEPKMYVISSEELEPYLNKEIESYRKDFNFTVFTVRHSDKYKRLYATMEEAELHYNKAHENLFNLLRLRITERSVVVIPSQGLAQVTLKEYVDPLVARKFTIIYPVMEYIDTENNNFVMVTQIGLTQHTNRISAEFYNKFNLDDNSNRILARAVIAMEVAKPFYNLTQQYIDEQEAHLEKLAERATFAAIVVNILFVLTMLNFIRRMTRGRRHVELVPNDDRSQIALAEAARIRSEREERERAIIASKERRDERKKDKQMKLPEQEDSIPDTITHYYNTSQKLRRRKKYLTEHSQASQDEVTPLVEGKLEHDFGPQREKVLCFMRDMPIDELNDLERFLDNQPDVLLKDYNREQMIRFLAKFECGPRQHSGKQHHHVTLPDGVNFGALIYETTDTKHSYGRIYKWFFVHLAEAFENLDITAATIDCIIKEKRQQATSVASKSNGSPRYNADF